MKEVLRSVAHSLGYDVIRYKSKGGRMHSDTRFGLDVFRLVVEDLVLRRPQDSLTLLQIGANDGVREDPVRPILTANGIRGVLVEPLPEPFQQLTATYADLQGVTTVNCAIGAQDGNLMLYHLAPNLVEEASLIASFDRANVEKWQSIWGLNPSAVLAREVPCRTVATLLREQGIETLTIAAVDTEGMDHIICNQLLDLPCPPEVLHFEYVNSPEFEVRQLIQRLEDMGYRMARSGLDITALRTP
ncbi:MAG: FkbM family methyltransferase, partial [Acidobacteriota bacterium]|nr:FkbM family methyltransferase [Acidobacteriota bacterium]